MAERFRHEHVSSVPSGWRAATVSHGDHRIRLAFPPGRRQKGAGRLVSVLHPKGENPCALKSTNPAELLIMGANPPRGRRNPNHGFRVVAVAKNPANPANPIFQSPTFRTKAEAKQAMKHLDKDEYYRPHIQRAPLETTENNPMELVVMGANPARAAANPDAAEVYENFKGEPPEREIIDSEPHMPKGDYAKLGELVALRIKPATGGAQRGIFWTEKDFDIENYSDRLLPLVDPPMVVSDASGRKIYFYKGDQQLGSAGDSGEVFLGEVHIIRYRTKKYTDDFEPLDYVHRFGEESGIRPQLVFDADDNRLLLKGGNYRIEAPGIID